MPNRREPLVVNRIQENILVTCMPKAGTHLLTTIIGMVLGRNPIGIAKSQLHYFHHFQTLADELGYRDFVLAGHFRRDMLDLPADWRVIALIRDPRDVVLSMRDFLERSPSPEHMPVYASIRDLDRDAQLKRVIDGIKVTRSFDVAAIERHCSGWLEWAETGGLIVRYEELFEPGAAHVLAEFLGADLARVRRAIQEGLGTPTATLNVGKPQRWTSEMSDDVKAYFRAQKNGLVERLGYSWDD